MTDTSSSSLANPLTGDHILLLAQALNANTQALMDLADSNHHLAQAMAREHGDLDDQDPEEVPPTLSMDGQRL